MAFFPDPTAAVRVAIYAEVVERGAAPTPRDVARTSGLAEADVEAAFRALADGHVIVLEPGTLAVAWAPPFSVAPTAFLSHAGGVSRYAPCAWDAFGIPAALHADAAIAARCAWSGEALDCGVRGGRAYGDAVIHLLVPARHFWDDIFFT
jgi:alkylmercury lyase-like protein